jgi:hypothetical protein
MRAEEKELINEKFSGLKSLLNAHFENVNDRLDDVIEHQKKSNGRIDLLETETTFFRWVNRNPKLALFLTILIIAGIIFLSIHIGIKDVIKLL